METNLLNGGAGNGLRLCVGYVNTCPQKVTEVPDWAISSATPLKDFTLTAYHENHSHCL